MNPKLKDKSGIARRTIYLVGWVFVIGVCVYALGGAFLLQGFQIHWSEKRLQSQKNYDSIASACAGLINQLGTNQSQHFDGKDAALPEVIRQFKPRYVYTYTNQVKVIFGDSAHHWGLFYADSLEPITSGPMLEFWADGRDSKKLWP